MRAFTTAMRAPLALASRNEIRPELSFRDHNQLGPQPSQVRPDGKGEVEREVEDILLAEASSSQLLACIRRRRNHDSIFRESILQLGHQTADRQNLAD